MIEEQQKAQLGKFLAVSAFLILNIVCYFALDALSENDFNQEIFFYIMCIPPLINCGVFISRIGDFFHWSGLMRERKARFDAHDLRELKMLKRRHRSHKKKSVHFVEQEKDNTKSVNQQIENTPISETQTETTPQVEEIEVDVNPGDNNVNNKNNDNTNEDLAETDKNKDTNNNNDNNKLKNELKQQNVINTNYSSNLNKRQDSKPYSTHSSYNRQENEPNQSQNDIGDSPHVTQKLIQYMLHHLDPKKNSLASKYFKKLKKQIDERRLRIESREENDKCMYKLIDPSRSPVSFPFTKHMDPSVKAKAQLQVINFCIKNYDIKITK
eukprot:gb/GECH01010988.1/.p1 GENE.gb/GECH01010988.1/~~gb/GECH01010988.1/.p1  ORF type:complete len:326 (+),score=81.36 gb/GECH01010988.1/:1-978(+)